MTSKTLGERIDVLEARLTFQDETIETLNKTITEQWLKIDALTRQLLRLSERLQEAETSAPGAGERASAALLRFRRAGAIVDDERYVRDAVDAIVRTGDCDRCRIVAES